jgi:hypothetical protein
MAVSKARFGLDVLEGRVEQGLDLVGHGDGQGRLIGRRNERLAADPGDLAYRRGGEGLSWGRGRELVCAAKCLGGC